MRDFRIILLLGICAFCACTPNAPVKRYSFSEFSSAYVQTHGHCYDSVKAAVISLDFYTLELLLDSANRMRGTGYNLYLSDLFVPDSLLEDGVYTADTSALAFTFLPGKSFGGTPTGCYLLTIENDNLTNIMLIDSGTVTIRDTLDGIKDIRMVYYVRRQRYTSHFQGSLTPKR
jgi:hypothetical protein